MRNGNDAYMLELAHKLDAAEAAARAMRAALTNYVALIADWRVTGQPPNFASLLIAQDAAQKALAQAEAAGLGE